MALNHVLRRLRRSPMFRTGSHADHPGYRNPVSQYRHFQRARWHSFEAALLSSCGRIDFARLQGRQVESIRRTRRRSASSLLSHLPGRGPHFAGSRYLAARFRSRSQARVLNRSNWKPSAYPMGVLTTLFGVQPVLSRPDLLAVRRCTGHPAHHDFELRLLAVAIRRRSFRRRPQSHYQWVQTVRDYRCPARKLPGFLDEKAEPYSTASACNSIAARHPYWQFQAIRVFGH